MTTDQLDALAPGTRLFIPVDTTVVAWVIDRRVLDTHYYTLTHPPDVDGVVSNKRPVYLHALDLLHATLDEAEAWKTVLATIEEHRNTINNRLNSNP